MQDAPYPEVPPDFGHWLAGFIDGEGCFGIDSRNHGTCYGCRLAIKLRADDRPILEEIAVRLGRGGVYGYAPRRKNPRHSPETSWCVTTKDDCAAMVTLFREYPLRAKKAADFALWSAAVRIWRSGAPTRWQEMASLQAILRGSRRFQAAEVVPAEIAPQLKLVV